ncbi:hypothetical protein ANANG_G00307400 [Anguilla anguilla]|uniref:Uncharacterized protein n=1 Tax=Anguilla anguilla TaxID=7936 RepID=A0A9D3RH56_ANGAN|nr:hypothetical protein ANANG_G00307400 [Anguilla anguilla]
MRDSSMAGGELHKRGPVEGKVPAGAGGQITEEGTNEEGGLGRSKRLHVPRQSTEGTGGGQAHMGARCMDNGDGTGRISLLRSRTPIMTGQQVLREDWCGEEWGFIGGKPLWGVAKFF